MCSVLKELNDLFVKRKQECQLFPFTFYPSLTRHKIYTLLKKHNHSWDLLFSEVLEEMIKKVESNIEVNPHSFINKMNGINFVYDNGRVISKEGQISEDFVNKYKVQLSHEYRENFTTTMFPALLSTMRRKPRLMTFGSVHEFHIPVKNFILDAENIFTVLINNYFYNVDYNNDFFEISLNVMRENIVNNPLLLVTEPENSDKLIIKSSIGNEQLFTMPENRSNHTFLEEFPANVIDIYKPLDFFDMPVNRCLLHKKDVKSAYQNINEIKEEIINKAQKEYVNLKLNNYIKIGSIEYQGNVGCYSFEHILLSANLKRAFENFLDNLYQSIENIYYEKLKQWLCSINRYAYELYMFNYKREMKIEIFNEILKLPAIYLEKISNLDNKQKEWFHFCFSHFDLEKNPVSHFKLINPDFTFNTESIIQHFSIHYELNDTRICNFALALKGISKKEISLSRLFHLIKEHEIENLSFDGKNHLRDELKKDNLIENNIIPVHFDPFNLYISEKIMSNLNSNDRQKIDRLVNVKENIFSSIKNYNKHKISASDIVADLVKEYGLQILFYIHVPMKKFYYSYSFFNPLYTKTLAGFIESERKKINSVPVLSYALISGDEHLFMTLCKYMKKDNLLKKYIDKYYPIKESINSCKEAKDILDIDKQNSLKLSIMDIALIGLNSEKVLNYINENFNYTRHSNIANYAVLSELQNNNEYNPTEEYLKRPLIDNVKVKYDIFIERLLYVHEKFGITFDCSSEFLLRCANEKRHIAKKIFNVKEIRREELFFEYDVYDAAINGDVNKIKFFKNSGLTINYTKKEFDILRQEYKTKSEIAGSNEASAIFVDEFLLDWIFIQKESAENKMDDDEISFKNKKCILSLLNVFNETEKDKENLLTVKGRFGNLLKYIAMIFDGSDSFDDTLSLLIKGGQSIYASVEKIEKNKLVVMQNRCIKDIIDCDYDRAIFEMKVLDFEKECLHKKSSETTSMIRIRL